MLDVVAMILVPLAGYQLGGGWGLVLGICWSFTRLVDQINEKR